MSQDAAPISSSEPLLRTLAPALRELEKRLRNWIHLHHPQPLSTIQKASLEGLADDLHRQVEALLLEKPVLIIMLMGGTGVGKSTLMNALAGGVVAHASFARPTTRDPVVYYHESIQPHKLDPALQLCKLAAHDRPHLEQKIIVDTPDVDSNDLGNREKLFRLLPIADIVLYIGSQEKYHDRLGWELFLEQRKRRAFAFVLNKWDRCHHPGAAGNRPDEDWLRDLQDEGFEKPLLFRTNAQHWVDHPWQNVSPPPPPPVEGEQFLELVRWIELGLNRMEIDAIKARGVSQLLDQLHQAMTDVCPPDLTAQAEAARLSWRTHLRQESQDSAVILLDTLDPYQKQIERHFAEERQKHFHGVMGSYLRLFNRFRYGKGISMPKIKVPVLSSLPNMNMPAERTIDFNLATFTKACSLEAGERHLESRHRALANRLLVEGENNGIPVRLLSDPTERAARQDWKNRHAMAMMETLAEMEQIWSNPTGTRRLWHRILVLLADWLPILTLGGMGTKLLWDYMYTQKPFHFTDLILPFGAMAMVLLVLHVLIAIFLPLRWQSIREDFQGKLARRIEWDLEQGYLHVPTQLAEDLLLDRKQVLDYLNEVGEVQTWLARREQAASIMGLYGK
jgi:energy-coupling factor transporter ATP-binding protein EcfA2